jgi:hypothetical protein
MAPTISGCASAAQPPVGSCLPQVGKSLAAIHLHIGHFYGDLLFVIGLYIFIMFNFIKVKITHWCMDGGDGWINVFFFV